MFLSYRYLFQFVLAILLIYPLGMCKSSGKQEGASNGPVDKNWKNYVTETTESEVGYEVHKMAHCMGLNPDKGKNKYKLFQVKTTEAWRSLLELGHMTAATYMDGNGSLGVGVHYWNPFSKGVMVLLFQTDRGVNLRSVAHEKIPSGYKMNHKQIFLVRSDPSYPAELFSCK